MAVTWARAEIQVDIDGSGVPRQVRVLAEAAASDGGKAFNKKFDDELSKWDGKGFNKGLKSMFKGEGAKDMNAWFDGVRERIKKTNKELDKHKSLWQRLSHNTRQWTLIIGAVIAGMEGLAVLGSAAGAGLVALGSALSSVVFGGAAAVIIFSNLAGEIDKLPKPIQAAAKAFQNLGKRFGNLRDELQIEALADTADAWDSLGDTIEGLTDAFRPLAKVINGLIKDMAKNLKPGTRGFKALFALIENSAPTFDKLVRIAGNFGVALAEAFVKAQPLVDGLLGWLDRLVSQFDKFVQSDDFEGWVQNALDVFGSLSGLLDSVGTALDELVTDEAVDRLINFIDNIGAFIEGPGADLLAIFGEMDIFGLISEALLKFGEALEPLVEPLKDLAEGLNDVVQSGIDTLAPIIEDVSEALAPFVQHFADFLKQNPKAIADFILGIAAAFLVMKGVKGISGLVDSLGGFILKMDDIQKKTPVWKSSIAGLVSGILLTLPGSADGEVKGTDVVTGFTSAMLLGFGVGGPVGAAFAFVGSLITSMISDLLDDQEGVWNTGWDQIFDPSDMSGAGIGEFKQFLGDTFTFLKDGIVNFFTEITAMVSTGWNDVIVATQTAFNNMMTAIITFFADMNANTKTWWADIQHGWTQFWGNVGSNIRLGWDNATADFRRGWQKIVDFFTTELPRFFKEASNNIVKGVTGLGTAFANGFQSVWNTVTGWVDRIASKIRNGLSQLPLVGGLFSGDRGGSGNSFASGGVLTAPRRILAGEAGPEAIVPLRRNLMQVNPQVRWLSAIAQGKDPSMASGVSVAAGRTLNIAPGAIVISGVRDPNAAAVGVVNRLAERIAS